MKNVAFPRRSILFTKHKFGREINAQHRKQPQKLKMQKPNTANQISGAFIKTLH
jgi:hypothetical protein